MDLFEIRNGRAHPSVHALLVEPYKTIWDEDTSEGKEKAIAYFTYIELLCSPKKSNPFYGYSEEERPAKVKKEVFKDENYLIDTELMLATITYKEHLASSSPAYSLMVAAESAADKLKEFLLNLNPNQKTNGGTLILKPRDITAALKEIPDTIKKMAEMRQKVHEELTEASKTRKDRTVGEYER